VTFLGVRRTPFAHFSPRFSREKRLARKRGARAKYLTHPEGLKITWASENISEVLKVDGIPPPLDHDSSV
jgi:hypothetical protein